MTTSQTKKITPSPYQAAIFKWVADPNPESKCIIVDAVAGSGKSTTLVEAMNYIPSGQNLMFVAFAKQNVEDLKPKLAANAQAATLNSIGYRAWMRYTGLSKIEINGQLNYTLIENYLSSDGAGIGEKVMSALLNRYREAKGLGRDYDRYRDILSSADMSDEVGPINRLISLAKGSGMVPRCVGVHDKYFSITDDTQDNWRSLIDTHALDIDYPEIAIEIGRRVLEDSIAISKNEIDYDSQLWLPVIHKANFLKYDWIMADECQDQNAIQNEIIFRMMKPDTRAIFVGDPFQAIYAFRGAMSNSMDVIQQRFNAHKFPLSICYRCAKSIVGHAKQLVPHIEHHEGQLDGELVYANIFGPKSFKKTDLVLCRNSRPLVELAYGLFREKVALRILGRDIEHGFIKLAKRCAGKKRGDVSIDVISENLQIWKDREIAKIRAKNSRDPKIGHVEDRAAALSVFIAELPEGKRTLKHLIKSIEDVFNSDPRKQQQPGSILTLSTIHKSKGTEYERVFILDRHLMPSKYALTDEAKQQEANIQYVARTRAKKALIYIDTKDYAANYNGPAMMEVENAVAL